ncbi:MAG TPA: hypothetical protein VKV28_00800 [Candidatus Binataceae bacterium]|nr:hypothetical protein [Candidatus Binataceae bacterium]
MVAAAVAIAPLCGWAQSQTNFAGPVAIQPQESPQAALQVDRVGNQPAAVDLYSHGGGTLMRFFAPDPTKGQVLRSYINDSGAFETNAWMVISGALSSDSSPTPWVLSPTSDSFMLGLWSDVMGPALVIRPTQTTPSSPTLATMDGYGNYRFSILDDGSLNFAASDSNTFTSTNWDTVLHRVGPGQLRAEAEFSATSLADTPSVVDLVNDSNSTINAAMVVKIDPEHDNAIVPVTSPDDPAVVGVAQQTIAPGAVGQVLTRGIGRVAVTGTVLRGSILVSAAAGVARALTPGEYPPPGAIIGKALNLSSTPQGMVTALIQQ